MSQKVKAALSNEHILYDFSNFDEIVDEQTSLRHRNCKIHQSAH